MKSVELLECNMVANSYAAYVDCLQSHLAAIPAKGSEEAEYDYRLHSAFSTAAGSRF